MKDENGNILEVHPYAARFPLMSDEELQDLAEDIKANGLKEPIVLDSDGTLIDGRNRCAACKILGIEPKSIVLNGDADQIKFVISLNINRRHLSVSQRAMLAALSIPLSNEALPKRPGVQKEAAEQAGVKKQKISWAMAVRKWAPLSVENVISGTISLDKAYEEALGQKKAAESDEAKMTKLTKAAADLADQVSEGKLTLAEAMGALDAREEEVRKETERLRQVRQLATEQLQKILILLRKGAGTTREKATHWIAQIDAEFIQEEITTERIQESLELLKELFTEWKKTYGKIQSKSKTEIK